MINIELDFKDSKTITSSIFKTINGEDLKVSTYGVTYSDILNEPDIIDVLYSGLSYLDLKYSNSEYSMVNNSFFIDKLLKYTDLDEDLMDFSEYDRLLSIIIDISTPTIKNAESSRGNVGNDKYSNIMEREYLKKNDYYESIGVKQSIYNIIKTAEFLRTKGLKINDLTYRKIYNLSLIHSSIDNDERVANIFDNITSSAIYEVKDGNKILNERIIELNK